jgi:hypothetical protein
MLNHCAASLTYSRRTFLLLPHVLHLLGPPQDAHGCTAETMTTATLPCIASCCCCSSYSTPKMVRTCDGECLTTALPPCSA